MDADVTLVKNILGKAAQADLTEKLIVLGVMWHFMSRKVSKHFQGMEQSVEKLSRSITEAAKTLAKRLDSAEARISKLEKLRSDNRAQHKQPREDA